MHPYCTVKCVMAPAPNAAEKPQKKWKCDPGPRCECGFKVESVPSLSHSGHVKWVIAFNIQCGWNAALAFYSTTKYNCITERLPEELLWVYHIAVCDSSPVCKEGNTCSTAGPPLNFLFKKEHNPQCIPLPLALYHHCSSDRLQRPLSHS